MIFYTSRISKSNRLLATNSAHLEKLNPKKDFPIIGTHRYAGERKFSDIKPLRGQISFDLRKLRRRNSTRPKTLPAAKYHSAPNSTLPEIFRPKGKHTATRTPETTHLKLRGRNSSDQKGVKRTAARTRNLPNTPVQRKNLLR